MSTFTGILQSGGTSASTPLSGRTVTLWAASGDAPVRVGSDTTDGSGAFSIDGVELETVLYYVVADVSPGVAFMALATRGAIVVNELTTVAAVWCAAQFLTPNGIQGRLDRLRIVAAMNENLVDVATGASSSVLLSSPNADETNALRTTRSLANLAAWCANDPNAVKALLGKLRAHGVTPPAGLLTALASIARNPARDAGEIYALSKASRLYEPALERQPDAWTIAVKVNDSGNPDHPFGGPGNLSFDIDGRAWIANNVVQGTPGSTPWSIVLDVDGRPAPMSPFAGGGLYGPGFGVDVDRRHDRIWFGNFGWGGEEPKGGASLFDGHAHAISPPEGWGQGVLEKVQGVVVDPAGNVWFASYGNGVVAVFVGGDSTSVCTYQGPTSFKPFDVAIASDGTAWVTNSDPDTSSIVHLQLVPNQPTLNVLGETVIGRVLKGIVIDSLDNVWAASGGNDHVYAFDANGKLLGGFQGGGIDGPWGLTLDGNDDVWAGDFGPLELGSNFHGRLTQLTGSKRADPEHGILLGDAISPQSGYTLPSAGSQVLLHDGTTPLYGENGPKCFIPMFRTTGLKVDGAGNVWTCNNWKPDFDIDTIGGNPGGDGMVIFIGLATPA